MSRADYLKAWATGFDAGRIPYYDYRDEKIDVFGDTALVRSTNKRVRLQDGVESVSMTMYTDIYVRRDGAWKCIQAQITPGRAGQLSARRNHRAEIRQGPRPALSGRAMGGSLIQGDHHEGSRRHRERRPVQGRAQALAQAQRDPDQGEGGLAQPRRPRGRRPAIATARSAAPAPSSAWNAPARSRRSAATSRTSSRAIAS